MATAKKSCPVELTWDIFSPLGPALAYHAACFLKGSLYIHGGITSKSDNTPSDKLYVMNLSDKIWQEIYASGSPGLSHHTCVLIQNRYILFIGGWDGRRRTTDVHIFDTEKKIWMLPKVSGFPEGGGLSSHTATLLSSGEILILGREGSLRIQKRYGNAYILSGSVEKGVFNYTEFSHSVTSRSGHTTNIVGSKMYVIGGRSDNLLEFQAGFSSGLPPEYRPPLTKFSEIVAKLKPIPKVPCGRKNHISVSGADAIFIHGGETFDGRSRVPVGEMYIVTTKPTIQFYKVGASSFGRAGHVCCVDNDRILIHGGIGERNTLEPSMFELRL